MSTSIVFNECGGPEVLHLGAFAELPPPAPEQVLLKHTAIGVNAVDIMYRAGAYGQVKTPSIPGFEAVGVVLRAGSNVSSYMPGDRVVYATAPVGAYRSERLVDQKYLVRAPQDITDEVLAATFFKGLSAHYLLHRSFITSASMTILVHAAGGDLGQIIVAWAKSKGITVLGTVDDDDDKQIALDAGCASVVNYKTEKWVELIKQYTDGTGVTAVYDMIGKEVFLDSLKCLKTFGIMLSVTTTSGTPDPLELHLLQSKSLFLTCPNIFDYKANRRELLLSAEEVFAMIRTGMLSPNIAGKYKLEDAQLAHQKWPRAQGSLILIP